MSGSVSNVIEMLEEGREDLQGHATLLSHSAMYSLMEPLRRVILGSVEPCGQGYERPPKGQTSGFGDEQYSLLPGDEENYNPNRLFAKPRVEKGEVMPPTTPMRLHIPTPTR